MKHNKKKNKLDLKGNSKGTKPWAAFMVVICGVIGAFGQLLLKLGAKKINSDIFSLINPALFFGLVFYGVAAILFIIALKYGEVTVLYPIIALSYVWVSILSMTYLGEEITLAKWFGNLLIIFGVGMIGFAARQGAKK